MTNPEYYGSGNCRCRFFHPSDRTVVEVWEIDEGVGNPGRSEKVRTEGVGKVNPRRAVARGGRPREEHLLLVLDHVAGEVVVPTDLLEQLLAERL